MFENIVWNLILRYASRYVLDFKPEQLKLSLWKGSATMVDIELNTEALEAELPIRIRRAHIERLSLRVPWTSLLTASVSVEVSGVTLELEAVSDAVDGVHSADADMKRPKPTASAPVLSTTTSPPTASHVPSYTDLLLQRLLENLVVTVSDVSVCFHSTVRQDDQVIHSSISCGVQLIHMSPWSQAQHGDLSWEKLSPTTADGQRCVLSVISLHHVTLFVEDMPERVRADGGGVTAHGHHHESPTSANHVAAMRRELLRDSGPRGAAASRYTALKPPPPNAHVLLQPVSIQVITQHGAAPNTVMHACDIQVTSPFTLHLRDTDVRSFVHLLQKITHIMHAASEPSAAPTAPVEEPKPPTSISDTEMESLQALMGATETDKAVERRPARFRVWISQLSVTLTKHVELLHLGLGQSMIVAPRPILCVTLTDAVTEWTMNMGQLDLATQCKGAQVMDLWNESSCLPCLVRFTPPSLYDTGSVVPAILVRLSAFERVLSVDFCPVALVAAPHVVEQLHAFVASVPGVPAALHAGAGLGTNAAAAPGNATAARGEPSSGPEPVPNKSDVDMVYTLTLGETALCMCTNVSKPSADAVVVRISSVEASNGVGEAQRLAAHHVRVHMTHVSQVQWSPLFSEPGPSTWDTAEGAISPRHTGSHVGAGDTTGGRSIARSANAALRASRHGRSLSASEPIHFRGEGAWSRSNDAAAAGQPEPSSASSRNALGTPNAASFVTPTAAGPPSGKSPQSTRRKPFFSAMASTSMSSLLSGILPDDPAKGFCLTEPFSVFLALQPGATTMSVTVTPLRLYVNGPQLHALSTVLTAVLHVRQPHELYTLADIPSMRSPSVSTVGDAWTTASADETPATVSTIMWSPLVPPCEAFTGRDGGAKPHRQRGKRDANNSDGDDDFVTNEDGKAEAHIPVRSVNVVVPTIDIFIVDPSSDAHEHTAVSGASQRWQGDSPVAVLAVQGCDVDVSLCVPGDAASSDGTGRYTYRTRVQDVTLSALDPCETNGSASERLITLLSTGVEPSAQAVRASTVRQPSRTRHWRDPDPEAPTMMASTPPVDPQAQPCFDFEYATTLASEAGGLPESSLRLRMSRIHVRPVVPLLSACVDALEMGAWGLPTPKENAMKRLTRAQLRWHYLYHRLVRREMQRRLHAVTRTGSRVPVYHFASWPLLQRLASLAPLQRHWLSWPHLSQYLRGMVRHMDVRLTAVSLALASDTALLRVRVPRLTWQSMHHVPGFWHDRLHTSVSVESATVATAALATPEREAVLLTVSNAEARVHQLLNPEAASNVVTRAKWSLARIHVRADHRQVARLQSLLQAMTTTTAFLRAVVRRRSTVPKDPARVAIPSLLSTEFAAPLPPTTVCDRAHLVRLAVAHLVLESGVSEAGTAMLVAEVCAIRATAQLQGNPIALIGVKVSLDGMAGSIVPERRHWAEGPLRRLRHGRDERHTYFFVDRVTIDADPPTWKSASHPDSGHDTDADEDGDKRDAEHVPEEGNHHGEPDTSITLDATPAASGQPRSRVPSWSALHPLADATAAASARAQSAPASPNLASVDATSYARVPPKPAPSVPVSRARMHSDGIEACVCLDDMDVLVDLWSFWGPFADVVLHWRPPNTVVLDASEEHGETQPTPAASSGMHMLPPCFATGVGKLCCFRFTVVTDLAEHMGWRMEAWPRSRVADTAAPTAATADPASHPATPECAKAQPAPDSEFGMSLTWSPARDFVRARLAVPFIEVSALPAFLPARLWNVPAARPWLLRFHGVRMHQSRNRIKLLDVALDACEARWSLSEQEPLLRMVTYWATALHAAVQRLPLARDRPAFWGHRAPQPMAAMSNAGSRVTIRVPIISMALLHSFEDDSSDLLHLRGACHELHWWGSKTDLVPPVYAHVRLDVRVSYQDFTTATMHRLLGLQGFRLRYGLQRPSLDAVVLPPAHRDLMFVCLSREPVLVRFTRSALAVLNYCQGSLSRVLSAGGPEAVAKSGAGASALQGGQSARVRAAASPGADDANDDAAMASAEATNGDDDSGPWSSMPMVPVPAAPIFGIVVHNHTEYELTLSSALRRIPFFVPPGNSKPFKHVTCLPPFPGEAHMYLVLRTPGRRSAAQDLVCSRRLRLTDVVSNAVLTLRTREVHERLERVATGGGRLEPLLVDGEDEPAADMTAASLVNCVTMTTVARSRGASLSSVHHVYFEARMAACNHVQEPVMLQQGTAAASRRSRGVASGVVQLAPATSLSRPTTTYFSGDAKGFIMVRPDASWAWSEPVDLVALRELRSAATTLRCVPQHVSSPSQHGSRAFVVSLPLVPRHGRVNRDGIIGDGGPGISGPLRRRRLSVGSGAELAREPALRQQLVHIGPTLVLRNRSHVALRWVVHVGTAGVEFGRGFLGTGTDGGSNGGVHSLCVDLDDAPVRISLRLHVPEAAGGGRGGHDSSWAWSSSAARALREGSFELRPEQQREYTVTVPHVGGSGTRARLDALVSYSRGTCVICITTPLLLRNVSGTQVLMGQVTGREPSFAESVALDHGDCQAYWWRHIPPSFLPAVGGRDTATAVPSLAESGPPGVAVVDTAASGEAAGGDVGLRPVAGSGAGGALGVTRYAPHLGLGWAQPRASAGPRRQAPRLLPPLVGDVPVRHSFVTMDSPLVSTPRSGGRSSGAVQWLRVHEFVLRRERLRACNTDCYTLLPRFRVLNETPTSIEVSQADVPDHVANVPAASGVADAAGGSLPISAWLCTQQQRYACGGLRLRLRPRGEAEAGGSGSTHERDELHVTGAFATTDAASPWTWSAAVDLTFGHAHHVVCHNASRGRDVLFLVHVTLDAPSSPHEPLYPAPLTIRIMAPEPPIVVRNLCPFVVEVVESQGQGKSSLPPLNVRPAPEGTLAGVGCLTEAQPMANRVMVPQCVHQYVAEQATTLDAMLRRMDAAAAAAGIGAHGDSHLHRDQWRRTQHGDSGGGGGGSASDGTSGGEGIGGGDAWDAGGSTLCRLPLHVRQQRVRIHLRAAASASNVSAWSQRMAVSAPLHTMVKLFSSGRTYAITMRVHYEGLSRCVTLSCAHGASLMLGSPGASLASAAPASWAHRGHHAVTAAAAPLPPSGGRGAPVVHDTVSPWEPPFTSAPPEPGLFSLETLGSVHPVPGSTTASPSLHRSDVLGPAAWHSLRFVVPSLAVLARGRDGDALLDIMAKGCEAEVVHEARSGQVRACLSVQRVQVDNLVKEAQHPQLLEMFARPRERGYGHDGDDVDADAGEGDVGHDNDDDDVLGDHGTGSGTDASDCEDDSGVRWHAPVTSTSFGPAASAASSAAPSSSSSSRRASHQRVPGLRVTVKWFAGHGHSQWQPWLAGNVHGYGWSQNCWHLASLTIQPRAAVLRLDHDSLNCLARGFSWIFSRADADALLPGPAWRESGPSFAAASAHSMDGSAEAGTLPAAGDRRALARRRVRLLLDRVEICGFDVCVDWMNPRQLVPVAVWDSMLNISGLTLRLESWVCQGSAIALEEFGPDVMRMWLSQQAVKQMLRVLGSLDVVGNLSGVSHAIGSGMRGAQRGLAQGLDPRGHAGRGALMVVTSMLRGISGAVTVPVAGFTTAFARLLREVADSAAATTVEASSLPEPALVSREPDTIAWPRFSLRAAAFGLWRTMLGLSRPISATLNVAGQGMAMVSDWLLRDGVRPAAFGRIVSHPSVEPLDENVIALVVKARQLPWSGSLGSRPSVSPLQGRIVLCQQGWRRVHRLVAERRDVEERCIIVLTTAELCAVHHLGPHAGVVRLAFTAMDRCAMRPLARGHEIIVWPVRASGGPVMVLRCNVTVDALVVKSMLSMVFAQSMGHAL